jgi:tungstate transport system ATP-binding protein
VIRQPGATATVSIKNLAVTFSARKELDVPALDVTQGEVLIVIGPNGSGKTTLLLCLALLTKPTTGTILYSGEPVADERRVLQLRRRCAVLFQEPLLLNTSVLENVLLGLKLRGIDKREAYTRAEWWLERFGVKHLMKRSARTLSGGETKRVSLARAFALEPEVLYLDEPFAALDNPTRQSLLEEFEGVLRETGVTTVMVTHDRNEALALADRVAVLIGGKIRQLGKPEEVFSYPVDEEVATFVEAGNILQGWVISQTEGLAVIQTDSKEIEAVSNLKADTKVTICLRHEDVTLTLTGTDTFPTSARNRFRGRVVKLFPAGSQVRITIDCGFPLIALITRRSKEGMGLEEGQDVVATFKASSVHLIKRS